MSAKIIFCDEKGKFSSQLVSILFQSVAISKMTSETHKSSIYEGHVNCVPSHRISANKMLLAMKSERTSTKGHQTEKFTFECYDINEQH